MLRILRAMTEADDWTAQVAWRPQGGYEYWQLVGCWRCELRLQIWWRRVHRAPVQDVGNHLWASQLHLTARADAHEPGDFTALEPGGAHLDRVVDHPLSISGLPDLIAAGPEWITRALAAPASSGGGGQ